MNRTDRNRYICVALSALVQGLLLGIYAVVTSGHPALARLRIMPPRLLAFMPLPAIFLVPLVFWLSQEHWGRRLWNLLGGLAAVLLALWAYRLWSYGGFDVIPSQKADLTRISLAVFMIVPFFQCRIASWSWKFPYSEMFFQMCRNLFLLFQASIVIAVFWGLLITAGLLFDIVGLHFVPLMLFNPVCAVPLSTIIIAVSISVAIKHPGIDSLGRWLLAVLAWLLPFFSVLSLAFLVCLLWGGSSGLNALWNTGQASTLMLLLQAGTLILANAAWLDGSKSAFRTRSIDILAQVSLLCLPLYSVLCLYAISLRISQYGLTADRVQALFLAVTAGMWGVAYAGTVIARNWPVSIGRVNIACVLFAALLVILMNSPVLDPLRLSAEDQISRLRSGEIQPEDFDYKYLASLGRYGREKLDMLNSGNDPAKSDPPSEIVHGNVIMVFSPSKVELLSQDRSLIGTIYGYFPPTESRSVKAVPVPPDYEIDGNIYRPDYVR
ncbi:MAG: DUF4153 domain-containing protein [Synergistaceae bacterium]|nr:DUF4153 domain-containing protein [Synergistaceae bacterium]